MVSTHIGFPTETVIVFIALSVGAIFIDLFMHRHDKPISLKSAALWSVFWVIVAMAFAGFLYIHHGAEVASLFVTGYALEKVLSVDNLFVMMAIFSWFSVPDRYRHRVLYWGIVGPSSSGDLRCHWYRSAQPWPLCRTGLCRGGCLDCCHDAEKRRRWR
jgi:tellurite resistance protein TerC